MRTLHLLWGPIFVAATVSAQAGPGVITPMATNDPVFNSTNLGNLNIFDANGSIRQIVQINFTKSSPNDTAGKWTAALTVYDLASTYGGAAGSQYVIMGQYDTTGTTPTFTPGTLANAMNNTGNAPCFGLMIEPRDGLYAAVDQASGVFMSWRKDNKSAFPSPVAVTVAPNTPSLPTAYMDPAPGYVNNQLMLFYIDKINSILMRPVKATFTSGVLTKAELQGNPTTVATLTIRPHSPTPIIDKGGEVRGLWMAANNSSDSDMFFMPSLNKADSPIMVFDNTAWLNNGGVAGGRLFCANNGSPTSASFGDAAWLLGSNTPIGGTATMTLGCRNLKNPAVPVVSRVALSLQLNNGVATPLPIPGWNGSYALNGPILIFTNMVGLDRDELAHWNMAVPNDTQLKGVRVAIQGISTPQGLPPTMTNTSHLEFY